MICIKCKKDIPEDSAFCNHCGASQQKPQKTRKQRGNGQGSVYKRGDKWAAEITQGYYIDTDGKRKRKVRRKCGFDKKKDALAYLETLRTQAQPVAVSSVADLYSLYHSEAEKKLSHSKMQAYEIAWKKIVGSVGFRKITALTVPELQTITDTAGTSYYTKRDIKNLLSHLYRIAIRDDITDKNRAQYIQLPEHETAERAVFTEDEIAELWSFSDHYIVKHILVMIYTGMRPAEILSVKVENIFLKDHYLTGGVKTRKSKSRKIIIADKVSSTLAELVQTAKGIRLSNYTKNAFYDAWNDFRVSHGIREELTPYCCRHTYVTRLTALKVSPAMLQELVGHEDYETTLEYTHLSIADRLAEVNRLA
ncbi:MAG: tyrosine-type recombinase/integrase [Oscillospiraceae bacterium]|nr:tyrosine-type recombinase/integrase [Bacteroidaceae bacterium]MBP0976013.1 tyrosine-type recombinase/integrase [Oscillospiraceae bacterium]MBP0987365.1 tyrosine-type recombinase/integrase [Oscillospiraceae bacterium]